MATSPIVPMPQGVRLYSNGRLEPCTALCGPCRCGSWHRLNEVIETCKQKGIYTKFLEDTFKQAIHKNSLRLVCDQAKRRAKQAGAKNAEGKHRIDNGGKRT